MKNLHLLTALALLLIASAVSAAELGNNCTTSMAVGLMVPSDCSNSSMVEGKTYCFGNADSKAAFDKAENKTEIIAKATAFYKKNAAAEPEREQISQQQALDQIKSTSCDLSNKDLGYLEFDKMDLRHCKMVNTSFFGAYLRGANLSGTNMQGAYLNLARLEDANLSGANLQDATIFQAIFDKTNFKGANLTNARMIGTLGNVDMSGANIVKGRFGLDIGNQPMGAMRFDAIGGNFADSNFEGADINRSNFKFADFRNANLRNTDLFRADLSKADLTGADITGANMNESILDGTIMTNVKGLEATKGYDISKGKCVDCMAIPIANSSEAVEAVKLGPAMLAAKCVMLQQQQARAQ
ncbi:MAG TPA: pentapeptide repeat-containing protein [Methylophilaceae bacterium]|nr:pentapeptide repeat-containing protein [Methylophilaceae bacterium]